MNQLKFISNESRTLSIFKKKKIFFLPLPPDDLQHHVAVDAVLDRVQTGVARQTHAEDEERGQKEKQVLHLADVRVVPVRPNT